ncbi:hypothetical protein ACWEKT_15935 [Nocardia takedensis]
MGARVPATMRRGAEWSRRFAATTPGVVSLIAVVSVLLCLVAGSIAAAQLDAKVTRHERVLGHTEPVAFAAQRLYVALSAADAAAAEAFLSGGIESPAIRARYRQALADAAAALAEATTGAGDARTREIVARIAADLPAFAGLVETARANNRQGFPVGSAYLREASALMRDSLLADAEELSDARFAEVRAEQREIAAVPVSSVLALLAVLAAAGFASAVLVRRTNRWVNPGLVAAGGAAVLALAWALGSTAIAGAALDNDSSGPSVRFESLAQARILAQQARTDETLQLIVRGDIADGEKSYEDHLAALRTNLAAALGPGSAAAVSVDSWNEGHRAQVEAYRSANFNAALNQAIGAGPQGSAERFAAVDRALGADLAAARAQLRDGVNDAGDALSWAPAVALLAMLGAAGAVVVGLWPRLKEFL